MNQSTKGLIYYIRLKIKIVNWKKPFFLSILYALSIICNLYITAQEIHYKTLIELETERMDKLKTQQQSFAIGLHYGNFELFSFAKASDNITKIDISDYHSMYNIEIEYYPYEKIAALFSIGLVVIPKEQSIDRISFEPGSDLGGIKVDGSGKGGAILPVTLGIKKTFLDGLIRPYLSLSSGFTYLKIGTASGSGGFDGFEKDIDIQSEFKFMGQLGSGVQLRLNRVMRFNCGVNFYGSPRFSPSIGGIDSYSGWYIFGGLNFILNSKK